MPVSRAPAIDAALEDVDLFAFEDVGLTLIRARGLDRFERSCPSLTGSVKLPDWAHSGRMAWPPPTIPLSVAVATSMTPPPDPRFSGHSAAAGQKDKARRAAVEERWAKEEEARQEESRRAYEASLRR